MHLHDAFHLLLFLKFLSSLYHNERRAPKKLVAKSKQVEPTTSSILLISVAIFLAIILVTHMGVMFTETMKQPSTCRDKIVGFEQRGMYANSDQFKLALSYCDVR
jgi:hypothetical protein